MTAPWGGRKVRKLADLAVAMYGPRCYHCRQPIDLRLPRTHPMGLSVEHVTPRSKGGTDAIENLRPCHLRENTSRGNRDLPARRPRSADWLAELAGVSSENEGPEALPLLSSISTTF